VTADIVDEDTHSRASGVISRPQ